jgi:hypothetical protein
MMYVKKIWSLNPTKYKYITIEKAIKGYENYIIGYIKSLYFNKDKKPKTFKSWLTTEI